MLQIDLRTLQIGDGFVDFIRGQERIATHPAFAALLHPTAAPPPITTATPSARADLQRAISATPGILAARAACEAAVGASMRQLAKHTAELDELKPVQRFAAAWDAEAYRRESRSLAQFRADMLMLQCAPF